MQAGLCMSVGVDRQNRQNRQAGRQAGKQLDRQTGVNGQYEKCRAGPRENRETDGRGTRGEE